MSFDGIHVHQFGAFSRRTARAWRPEVRCARLLFSVRVMIQLQHPAGSLSKSMPGSFRIDQDDFSPGHGLVSAGGAEAPEALLSHPAGILRAPSLRKMMISFLSQIPETMLQLTVSMRMKKSAMITHTSGLGTVPRCTKTRPLRSRTVLQGGAEIFEIVQAQVGLVNASGQLDVGMPKKVLECPYVLYLGPAREIYGVGFDAVLKPGGQFRDGMIRAARRYSVMMVAVAP